MKCNPQSLLEQWWRRGLPGHEADWRNDKLYLMLVVHELMRKAQWWIIIGCVTLRGREAVETMLAAKGGKPEELHIYCNEDLASSFPPNLS